MTKSLNLKFEQAVRFLAKHLPPSAPTSRKPVLFHDIRVGVYLYDHDYAEDIVLAGLLHDTIEWSDATEKMLKKEFGENVLNLVLANTKNDSIKDSREKTTELIRRCIDSGQDALIIKTADILDSFQWYASQNNIAELKYCMENANAIIKYKPKTFNDKIFKELLAWQKKYNHLIE